MGDSFRNPEGELKPCTTTVTTRPFTTIAATTSCTNPTTKDFLTTKLTFLISFPIFSRTRPTLAENLTHVIRMTTSTTETSSFTISSIAKDLQSTSTTTIISERTSDSSTSSLTSSTTTYKIGSKKLLLV